MQYARASSVRTTERPLCLRPQQGATRWQVQTQCRRAGLETLLPALRGLAVKIQIQAFQCLYLQSGQSRADRHTLQPQNAAG